MLRQATVEDISNSRVTKRHGRIIVVTRYYPRFLKKPLITEYEGNLAPTKELLTEFKDAEREIGDHNAAFEQVDYEAKFTLNDEGLARLEELSIAAQAEEIYFVCHCAMGQKCHREILMRMAAEFYSAPVARTYFDYKKLLSRGLGALRKSERKKKSSQVEDQVEE